MQYLKLTARIIHLLNLIHIDCSCSWAKFLFDADELFLAYRGELGSGADEATFAFGKSFISRDACIVGAADILFKIVEQLSRKTSCLAFDLGGLSSTANPNAFAYRHCS